MSQPLVPPHINPETSDHNLPSFLHSIATYPSLLSGGRGRDFILLDTPDIPRGKFDEILAEFIQITRTPLIIILNSEEWLRDLPCLESRDIIKITYRVILIVGSMR